MQGSSKYHNRKVQFDGMSFDSAKECRRYKELKLLQNVGKISGLDCQTELIVVPAQTAPDGKHIRAIKYIADFTYNDACGNFVVEDVKPDSINKKGSGYRSTAAWNTYQIKKKMLYFRTGIWIKEV